MKQQSLDQKVLVAMSGGVDSSVTAALLKKQGYQVIGIHLQLWNHSQDNLELLGARCCSLSDSQDARRVCDQLDIPYYVINAQDVFREKVVDYFVHEYLQQRTPNPCVQCNSHIKFNYLFQKADELGCHWVATGHYAQIIYDPKDEVARLYKAIDLQKDQTYFLFGMTQKALKRTLMPLGCLKKMMVRALADEYGLSISQKADSQEICFIGQEGYPDFIRKHTPESLRPKGRIETLEGKDMGGHEGLYLYTIGQKKGLKLQTTDTTHYSVVGFRSNTQTLLVGPEQQLLSKKLMANQCHWLSPIDTLRSIRCQAKIRSRHEEADCQVICFESDRIQVEFDIPQKAITPGQAIVFYHQQEVLGGAFIESVGEPT